jgi:hypothetical protein
MHYTYMCQQSNHKCLDPVFFHFVFFWRWLASPLRHEQYSLTQCRAFHSWRSQDLKIDVHVEVTRHPTAFLVHNTGHQRFNYWRPQTSEMQKLSVKIANRQSSPSLWILATDKTNN